MTAPRHKASRLLPVLVSLAVALPVLLIIYMLTGHGALDDIMLYTKTWTKLAALLALAASTAVSFIAGKLRNTAASKMTLAMSCITLAVSLYCAADVILPRYVRYGDISPVHLLTSGRQPGTFRFAAAGDPHIGKKESRTDLTLKMLGHIQRGKYDAFFLLGDLVDHGYDHGLWVKALRDMASLNSVMPICYVPGNHDTMFGGSDFYKAYCLPGGQANMWQRIDISNIHFLVLDVEWVTQTYTKEQEEWLKRQLADIPSRDWCIVMSHSFYYCSGRKKDGWEWYDNSSLINKVSPLFEQHGVDLVLSGHMHQAEILRKNGVTYAVMGSFGGELDRGREYTSPASVWYKARQYGFLDVAVRDNSAELVVRDAEDNAIYSMKLSIR